MDVVYVILCSWSNRGEYECYSGGDEILGIATSFDTALDIARKYDPRDEDNIEKGVVIAKDEEQGTSAGNWYREIEYDDHCDTYKPCDFTIGIYEYELNKLKSWKE